MGKLIQQTKKHPALRASVPTLPELETDPAFGLTAQQVQKRQQAGLSNTPVDSASKSVRQIVLSNLFTFFNLIFFLLAGCVIAVRSWLNLTFLFIVFANIVIGIVQELRSKKTLDRLSILNAPQARVIREGLEQTIDTACLVRDDVVLFSTGDQICADAVVVEGSCQANEALITGEADEIRKEPGDSLMSGSFLVSGSCRARLTAVGAQSFAAQLTLEAKQSKKPQQSEMMRSLTNLVKWIGIILIPFGIVLFIKEISWLGRDIATGVVSTVAALIGMIPEGLYLLTSLALVASILRLAKKQTLVHEMACIETLARVDTLCVDKTGTITENKMVVEDLDLLCPDRFIESDIRQIMSDYVYAMQDDNDTMAALRRYFTGQSRQIALETLPFTSAKKYGGVSFDREETYLLGAPDVLLGSRYNTYRSQVEPWAAKGCRVLLLGLYDGSLQDQAVDSAALMPLALILLANRIRKEAPATFAYFAGQGVAVKVISGDNPVTVSEVARRAGIPGAEAYIDTRELTDPAALAAAAERYTVFGRVTPEQKRALIRAMKAAGHTVAMTGDGVNDVLALKEANCSVAMASGSEAAAQVSHIVLLNSDFSAMPSVVEEGRRVINNIERSASLFLVKNIFSFLLAFVTLFATLPYPFSPSQLSLVNGLTIGLPSFVLAMEPNRKRVEGRFLPNVLYRALPAALTDLVLIVGILLFYLAFDLSDGALSTICTAVMGVVGLLMVHRTCRPYNKLRAVLMAGISVAFAVCFLFLKDLFILSALQFSDTLILVVFSLLAWPTMNVLDRGLDGLRNRLQALFRRKHRSKRTA